MVVYLPGSTEPRNELTFVEMNAAAAAPLLLAGNTNLLLAFPALIWW